MMQEPKYNEESWDIPIEEFKWRIMRTFDHPEKGTIATYAAYPDARTVSHHLDRLFGPAGWTDEYQITPDQKSVVCTLKVRMGDEWISKSDVGNVSDIEPMKGGFSDAFKRAAAKLGVGRNAYDIPELKGPVYTRGNRHSKPFNGPDGKPMDEWLVEQAYKALTGEIPKSQTKPQSSDPEPEAVPATPPSKPAPAPQPHNEIWVSFMDVMKGMGDEGKERVKAWWRDNGDDTSSPTPDTDPALLTKVLEFATAVFAEAELGATVSDEPF